MRVEERRKLLILAENLGALRSTVAGATTRVDRIYIANEITRIQLQILNLMDDAPHDTP